MEQVPIRLGRLRTSVRESAPVSLNILTHGTVDASSTSSSLLVSAASRGRVCRVCTTNTSRYTCPRCNLPYCSVDCYRSHGESCTEQFYQEHVSNEMAFDEKATAAVDPKAQRARATQELLTRVKQFHDETSAAFDGQENASNEQQLELSMERLAQLALMDDAELTLDSLTEDERLRFLADVAGGRMSKFVTPWEPWWLMSVATYEKETLARRKQLIIEMMADEDADDGVIEIPRTDDRDEEEEEQDGGAAIESSRFPAALLTRDMERAMPPSMQSLVRGGASGVSPVLQFHLVELLFAYAWTMRTFNGDWTQDPEEAALSVLHGSDVLRDDARFTTLDEAVIKCLEQRGVDGAHQAATNRLVLGDVVEILQHRVFVLDALTDMTQLLSGAADEIKTTRLAGGSKMSHKKSTATTKQDRAAVKKLFTVTKKVEFYRIWRFHTSPSSRDLITMTAQLRTRLDGLGTHTVP